LYLLKRNPRRSAKLRLAEAIFKRRLRNRSPTRWSSSFFVFIARSIAPPLLGGNHF
jgi:hypothetical protein